MFPVFSHFSLPRCMVFRLEVEPPVPDGGLGVSEGSLSLFSKDYTILGKPQEQ